jgi:Tfp pilus assembly protein FimT
MHSEPSKVVPPKRKRRWFQFSLRTLMIVVVIFSVQCGVCLPMLREWQEQERIREERQRQETFSYFVSLVR